MAYQALWSRPRGLGGLPPRALSPPTGTTVEVGIVGRDDAGRLSVARAFDAAPASWRVTLHRSVPAHADVVVLAPDVAEQSLAGGTAASRVVLFDPSDPHKVLNDVAEAARPRAAGGVVIVTSASGGTGATTVSLHLARRAAARGSACFVDCDLMWGAAERLGHRHDGVITWGALGDADESVSRAALPVPGGFRALFAPTSEAGISPEDVVARAADAFERVVVDVPCSGSLPALLAQAAAAVVVMPPTITGARRARRLLEMLPRARWVPVANRLGPGGESSRTELERILGRRIAIELPCSAALRDAEDDGRLLRSSLSRWAHALNRLEVALHRALATHGGAEPA